MNEWSTVARRKLAELIRCDKFIRITSVNFDYVILQHKSDYCKCDKFGRITWDVTGKFDE